MTTERIGSRIQSLRKQFRLTQVSLAAASGISRRELQNIEMGVHEPTARNLQALAEAFERNGFARTRFFIALFPSRDGSAGGEVASRTPVAWSSTDDEAIRNVALGRLLLHELWPKAEDYETQLAWARVAEELLSSNPQEAIKAAWYVVDLLIQSGRYSSAEAEVTRIFGRYPADLDVERHVGFLYQQGRLRYAAGDASGAHKAYGRAVTALQESGRAWRNLANHPTHFLARSFGGLGSWHEAETGFSASYGHHMRDEAFHLVAFDILWRTQMRVRQAEIEGARYDALPDLKRASELFGGGYGARHAELERAQVLLRDGLVFDPRDALEEWRDVGYAKGVALYFRLRMNTLSSEGRVIDALEAGVASLAALPNDRNLWADVWKTLLELRRQLDTPIAELERLRQRANESRGMFEDVEPVARDHLASVDHIIERLKRG